MNGPSNFGLSVSPSIRHCDRVADRRPCEARILLRCSFVSPLLSNEKVSWSYSSLVLVFRILHRPVSQLPSHKRNIKAIVVES